jgi:hypothetical protein
MPEVMVFARIAIVARVMRIARAGDISVAQIMLRIAAATPHGVSPLRDAAHSRLRVGIVP